MAFDFPNTPTLNQVISGPGGIQFKWDGVKWVAGPVAAPSPFVAKAGDTMTGALVLPGNAASALQAVPLQQLNASTAMALNDVGRNLLHNPLFAIQQRGVGPWNTNGAMTADRWLVAVQLDTINVSTPPLSDADRAAIGDEAGLSALQNIFTGNAAAGAANYIEQRIENVRRLAGKTVTVSFYANASAALKLGLNMFQLFGSGGSPSAFVQVLATGIGIQIGTTWQRYTATITLPSVAGKTFGTNGNDYTILRFHYSAGATSNQAAGNIGVQSGIVNLWGVQLEIGSVATPLEKPDPQQDLAKCQRFYQVLAGLQAFTYSQGGASSAPDLVFLVTMRAMPTSILSNLSYSNATATTVSPVSSANATRTITVTAGGNAWAIYNLSLSADL